MPCRTKLKLFTLLWGCLALLASNAGAAEGAPVSNWDLARPAGKVSHAFSLFTERLNGLPTYQERLDLEVEETLTNNTFTLRATPWAWVRVPEAVGADRRSSRAYFEMKEGWAELATSALDVRVGNQIFAWGAADQINPTDVWNPRDLYDPFQNTKLPITALRVNVHPPQTERLALEVIYTPFFRESRTPLAIPQSGTRDLSLSDSRWLPLPSRVVVDGLSAPLQYKVTEATYPNTWQLGGRLKLMRMGGWDFSAMGYSGVETFPRWAITRRGSPNDPALPLTLTLHPSFHRQMVYGLDGAGSLALGDMELGARFESAYFHRDNSRAETAPAEYRTDLTYDDDVQAVAGIDYTFKRMILGTVLYMNLSYVHYQNLGTTEHAAGQLAARGLPNLHPWDDNLVLYWEHRMGDAWKLGTAAIGSFKYRDGLLSPTLHYSLSDNFKLALGADLFLGNSDDGFFSQFRDNRRATFNASYSF